MLVNNDTITTMQDFSACILNGKLGREVKNCTSCQYKVYGSDCYRKLAKQCLSLIKRQHYKIEDLEYELQQAKKTN